MKKMVGVKEFLEEFFIKIDEYVRNDGVKVIKYKPMKDMFTKSLNMETGKIERAKIIEFSVHENLDLYEIKDKRNRFQPFKASGDHSLIVYNIELDEFEKISPVEILNMPFQIKKSLYFIKVLPNNKVKRIPITDIEIRYSGKGTAYDMTLDKNFTFVANDIVVQDTMAQYAINTVEAKQDIFNKRIHATTFLRYHRNDDFLHKLRHEYLYALNQLSTTKYIEKIIEIDSIEDFKPNPIILFKEDVRKYAVRIKNQNITLPYGLVYLNYRVFNKKLYLKETDINKKKVRIVNEVIIEYLNKEEKLYEDKDLEKFGRRYLDLFHEIMLVLSEFSYSKIAPKLTLDDYITPNKDEVEKILNNIPNEPIFGLYLLNKYSEIVFKEMEKKDTELWKIYQSGARASRDQIEQTIYTKGFLADAKNIVQSEPVRHPLNKGLTKKELFMSAHGARKGEIDKMVQTPRSGFLQRTGLYNLSFIMFDEDTEDCGTDKYFKIKVKNEVHAKSLIGRYYKDEELNREILITKNNYESIIGKEILLRSPITCKLPGFKVCKKCGGYESIKSKQLGMLSIQYITERFTQLILRTFHTSGRAIIKIPNEILEKYKIELNTDDGYIEIHNKEYTPQQLINEVNKFLEENGYDYRIELIDVKIGENGIIKFKVKGNGKLVNDDIVTKIVNIEKIIKSKMIDKDIFTAYDEITDTLLGIELIKSVMIETILSALWFLKEENEIEQEEDIELDNDTEVNESKTEQDVDDINRTLRYFIHNNNVQLHELDLSKFVKLPLPKASERLSPILAFLYEPSKRTLRNMLTETKDTYVESAFDKIFM